MYAYAIGIPVELLVFCFVFERHVFAYATGIPVKLLVFLLVLFAVLNLYELLTHNNLVLYDELLTHNNTIVYEVLTHIGSIYLPLYGTYCIQYTMAQTSRFTVRY